MTTKSEIDEPRSINISGLRKRAVKHKDEYKFEGGPFTLLFNSFSQSERFASMLVVGARATLVAPSDISMFSEVLFAFVQKRHRWWVGSLPNGSLGILRDAGNVGLLFPIIKAKPRKKL